MTPTPPTTDAERLACLLEREHGCWKGGCKTKARWLCASSDWPPRAAVSCGKHRHQLLRRGWDHTFRIGEVLSDAERHVQHLRGHAGHEGQTLQAVFQALAR